MVPLLAFVDYSQGVCDSLEAQVRGSHAGQRRCGNSPRELLTAFPSRPGPKTALRDRLLGYSDWNVGALVVIANPLSHERTTDLVIPAIQQFYWQSRCELYYRSFRVVDKPGTVQPLVEYARVLLDTYTDQSPPLENEPGKQRLTINDLAKRIDGLHKIGWRGVARVLRNREDEGRLKTRRKSMQQSFVLGGYADRIANDWDGWQQHWGQKTADIYIQMSKVDTLQQLAQDSSYLTNLFN